MSEEFVSYITGHAFGLSTDEIGAAVRRIHTSLLERATVLKDRMLTTPGDAQITRDALDSAIELLVFGLMIDIGNKMTIDHVRFLYEEAKRDPESGQNPALLELLEPFFGDKMKN